MTRRLHEYELEIRRLENEREELTAAYKEAEAVSESVGEFKVADTFYDSPFFYRVVKLRRNVRRLWLPSMDNSVTMLNDALLLRKKKSKLFGAYDNTKKKIKLDSCRESEREKKGWQSLQATIIFMRDVTHLNTEGMLSFSQIFRIFSTPLSATTRHILLVLTADCLPLMTWVYARDTIGI